MTDECVMWPYFVFWWENKINGTSERDEEMCVKVIECPDSAVNMSCEPNYLWEWSSWRDSISVPWFWLLNVWRLHKTYLERNGGSFLTPWNRAIGKLIVTVLFQNSYNLERKFIPVSTMAATRPCFELFESSPPSYKWFFLTISFNHLCGLVVRVPGYRSRGPTSEFDSRRYQIFWEVVCLEPEFSLVCVIDELLERKSSGSGLENRDYGRRYPPRWPRFTSSIRKSWH
jgi:hypothetical protein